MRITIERGKKKYELLVGRRDCDPNKCAFTYGKDGKSNCPERCNLPDWYFDLINKFSLGLVYPREIK